MMIMALAHGVAHRTAAMHTGHWNGIGTNMGKKTTLSKSMTEAEFDNGYWYATELKKFAVKVGIPSDQAIQFCLCAALATRRLQRKEARA
jgi:hypothetical protein